MNPAFASLAQLLRTRAYHQFVEDCRTPRDAQERTLARLVARNGRTRVGRRLGVARVRSLPELQAILPLSTYDDFAADAEATLRGERDVLVAGDVEYFSLTAGTSGARKALPVTPEYRREFQGPMNLFLYGVHRDHPRAFDGRVLYYVAGGHVETSPAGVPMGAISGYNYRNVPPLLKTLYAAPWEAFEVAEAQARSYCVALCALRHEVSFAVAVTTQPLAHIGHVMRRHADDLLRDLADGTLHPPGILSPGERRALAPHLRADPRRARVLASRASAAGSLEPRSAWPSLALLSCWYHAGAGAHAAELRRFYGRIPWRTAVYSASEGWINVPLRDETHSGVLAVGANVYEFIPLDAGGARAGDPVLADGLEQGRRYSLVMTSGAGLWRYQLCDVVECTGFFQRAPLLTFVQKEGNVLSLAHDLTNETHVEQVVASLRRQGLAVDRFCFGPGPAGALPPRYCLAVAQTGKLDEASLGTALDAALAEANYAYLRDRRSESLAPAEARVVAPSVFEETDRRWADAGAGAQVKPVSFSKDGRFLSLLLGGDHGA